jgi:gluconate 5-dehydrogenase
VRASSFWLAGRTALVTDTAGGVGLLIARALADAGARVVVHGQDIYTTEETLQRIGAYRARTCCFDIADDAAVVRSIAKLETARWPVDILVNNADDATAAASVSRAAAERMIARGAGGRIINVGAVGPPAPALMAQWAQHDICVRVLEPAEIPAERMPKDLPGLVVSLASTTADYEAVS